MQPVCAFLVVTLDNVMRSLQVHVPYQKWHSGNHLHTLRYELSLYLSVIILCNGIDSVKVGVTGIEASNL